MYWIPYHIFFLRKSNKKKKTFGKSTGLRFFLVRIISGIGPAIGGLIIVNFGFNALFMTSIIVLVIAALPIALVIHEWKHKDHKILEIIEKRLFNPKNIKSNLSFMGSSAESILYSAMWPILLFLVIDNFASIGFLNTFSFLVSSVTVLLIGKFIDKHGSKLIHGVGASLNTLLYLPRMIFSNPYLFYALDITDRLIMGTYTLPMMSLAYKKARKRGGSDYFIYRELSCHAGVIIGVSISLIALQFIHDWRLLFAIAMIGSLLGYLIQTEDN
jgi:MFS family permease